MANELCTRRLTRELRALEKSPLTNPRVYTIPLETNILEWHYVIEGSKETPYEGGYYWGKLVFPTQYPLKPPSVIMLTPNGRFTTGRRLCLSMSDFHPESWNPMWSVSTIITGLISFMVEKAPTLGSIESTDAQKRQYARQSLDYNVKDPTFSKLFPELVDLHKEQIRLVGESSSTANASSREVSSWLGGAGGGAHVGAAGEIGDDVIIRVLLTAAAGFVAFISILFAMRFI